MEGADSIVASRVTLAEVRRVLSRIPREDGKRSALIARAREQFAARAITWEIIDVTETIWNRVEESFPHEPVGTMDAVHLATGLLWRERLGDLHMLSTDQRIVENWKAFGLPVVLS